MLIGRTAVWIAALTALALPRPGWAQAPESPEAPPAAAPTPAPSAPADDDGGATARARRHFRVGIKLYRDANYKGALAEFEAAYREKPGSGSLQNVALCLKALFRYAEAATTLRLLLERHADELSPAQQQALQNAVQELESLIGAVQITYNPPQVELSVDGQPISKEQAARGVPLSVGEHTVAGDAPGYARSTQIIRVASQQQLRLDLRLRAVAGFLEISADDPKAAIAVDDEPLAYHHWSGPVTPDVEHVIQIYREGFDSFERTVRVELGKTVRVRGELGAATGVVDERTPLPAKPTAPPRPKGPVGYYGLVAVSVVGLNDAPLDLKVSDTDANRSVPSFGLRGGYRLSEFIAVEGAVDFGRVDVKGACQLEASSGDPSKPSTTCQVTREYSLRSLRFGPNLRLMTRGETVRFATAIGAGVVSHTLKLEPAKDGDVTYSGGSASGVDPYFCLELGAAFNYRHLYAELAAVAFIEGASGLSGAFDAREKAAVFDNGTLPMLGLTLKVGYSSWVPRR